MKKILFLITITASLFIIKDLLYSIYTLWHKNDLLIVAQRELIKERKQNLKLRTELSEASKATFIEEEARNKLFMVKPGESVVVVPEVPHKTELKVSEKPLPTWQQWWELFF